MGHLVAAARRLRCISLYTVGACSFLQALCVASFAKDHASRKLFDERVFPLCLSHRRRVEPFVWMKRICSLPVWTGTENSFGFQVLSWIH